MLSKSNHSLNNQSDLTWVSQWIFKRAQIGPFHRISYLLVMDQLYQSQGSLRQHSHLHFKTPSYPRRDILQYVQSAWKQTSTKRTWSSTWMKLPCTLTWQVQRVSLRGTRTVSIRSTGAEKWRLTVVLAVNAGSQILPATVIFKGKRELRLYCIQSPEELWMERWIKEIYLKHTKCKEVLLSWTHFELTVPKRSSAFSQNTIPL